MKVRKPLDDLERVKKEHFLDEIKENKFSCYVCGIDLWDDHKKRLKYKTTFRFKGRKTGDLIFACSECKTIVAIIRAKDLHKDS